MEEINEQKQNQEQEQEQQQDNTPKWLRNAITWFAVGSCSVAIAAFFGLFGDAPGQCIKNWSNTRNYQKRLDANYKDMIRRDQYYQNRRKND